MKLTKEQLNEFIIAVELNLTLYKDWRKGQCYFNVLHRLHSELANEIRGSYIDPFYDDSKIELFLTYISDETRL